MFIHRKLKAQLLSRSHRVAGDGSYLQGESDNFEALLHRVELLSVKGVVYNVGPQFNVLVAQIPEPAKMQIRKQGNDFERRNGETYLGALLSESL